MMSIPDARFLVNNGENIASSLIEPNVRVPVPSVVITPGPASPTSVCTALKSSGLDLIADLVAPVS